MGRTLAELLSKKRLLVAGLSGGSSCGGVDAGLCDVSGDGAEPLRVVLLAWHEEPYSMELRKQIVAVAENQPIRADDFARLHFRVGQTFARAAERLLQKAGRTAEELDLIGSHGQSLAHLPPRVDVGIGATGILKRGSTLQLGEPAMIAERFNVAVVSNFRARDMAAGGQGAPLAPYADYLLFSHAQWDRAVVTLGAVTHVTCLPKGGAPEATVAFDSGAGTMVMDGLVHLMTMGRQRFDADAKLARLGKVDGFVMDELSKHPYLKLPPPKSTGRQEFGSAYAKYLYERGIARGVRPSDILRTATDFTAIALADSLRRFMPGQALPDQVILAGGGMLNPVLMERLRKELGAERLHSCEEVGLPPKAKDALVFAVLAREAVFGRPANLPSATGAGGPRVLGQITPA